MRKGTTSGSDPDANPPPPGPRRRSIGGPHVPSWHGRSTTAAGSSSDSLLHSNTPKENPMSSMPTQLVSRVAALLLAPGLAAAQSTAPVVPQVKEQIEVVATRLPEAPDDVPAAIEVIAGDTLRAAGVRTLPQALALASGVDVVPGGDNGPASSVRECRGL